MKNAIGQRIADNKGQYDGHLAIGGNDYYCSPLPTSVDANGKPDTDASNKADGSVLSSSPDLGCLVPTYIPTLPYDPTLSTTPVNSSIGYTVGVDAQGRVTVCAPQSQSPVVGGVGEKALPDAPAICVTR